MVSSIPTLDPDGDPGAYAERSTRRTSPRRRVGGSSSTGCSARPAATPSREDCWRSAPSRPLPRRRRPARLGGDRLQPSRWAVESGRSASPVDLHQGTLVGAGRKERRLGRHARRARAPRRPPSTRSGSLRTDACPRKGLLTISTVNVSSIHAACARARGRGSSAAPPLLQPRDAARDAGSAGFDLVDGPSSRRSSTPPTSQSAARASGRSAPRPSRLSRVADVRLRGLAR